MQCEHGSAAPDDLIAAIEESQAGAGRHKCVICAFQHGVSNVAVAGDVERCAHGSIAPIAMLVALPPSQAGTGRHRCTVCAFAAGLATGRGELQYPDEILRPDRFIEGARRTVTVNAYERNREARAACIAHHGAICAACDTNLRDIYGDAADGLIHVHHLRALADIRAEYVLDSIQDLRPLCPNCHAVVHRGDPMFTIDAVREMIRVNRQDG